MDNAPLVNSGSAPADAPERDFSLEEQLELFPELPKELPKNLGILKNGSKTMLFVAEYFATGNATQSVINAGYGCTRESARRMGHALLTRIDIREALAYLDKQIKEDALVSKQSVIASILETRSKAEESGGVSMLRVVNECDRLLAQIKGMLREKMEISGDALGSLAELKNFVSEAKKEEAVGVENEQE